MAAVHDSAITQQNVGRIAERIVANELEARGFRVLDLNRQGVAANADLLAVKNGMTYQVQVKGATNHDDPWWVEYGFCTQDHIDDRTVSFFNPHKESFYQADVVVLVAVCTPSKYRCIVLPLEAAERAVQLNLDWYFRAPKRDGGAHKPHKMWIDLEATKKNDPAIKQQQERALLLQHEDAWHLIGAAAATQSAGR